MAMTIGDALAICWTCIVIRIRLRCCFIAAVIKHKGPIWLSRSGRGEAVDLWHGAEDFAVRIADYDGQRLSIGTSACDRTQTRIVGLYHQLDRFSQPIGRQRAAPDTGLRRFLDRQADG